MAGLLDNNYRPDPLAQGLLGFGTALMTPRQMGGGMPAAMQAFGAQAQQAQMMRRQMDQDAQRQQMLAQQMEMQRERFGMEKEKFGFEKDQYAQQQALSKEQMERMQRVRAELAYTKPELLPLFDADPKEAMKRMFPEPGKPTIVPKGAAVLGPDGKPSFTNVEPPEMTAMEKNLRAAGIDPQSPQGQALLRQYAQKNATHAPAPSQTVYTGTMVQAEGPDGRPMFVMPSKDGTVSGVPGLAPPGTKKDADAAANRIKAETDRARLMIATVDQALANVGPLTTGFSGSIAGKVAGSKAYDLRATIETLKANLGFQQLAEMRAASPTGGALGAIAVQELIALQSTLASIDANQSEKALTSKLNQIKTHYGRWLDAVQRSGGASGQAPANAGGATGSFDAPASGGVMRFDKNGNLVK
jgi:hypothetical protein